MTAAVKEQFDVFAPDAPAEAIKVAQQLALKAGPHGITVDNVTVKLTQQGFADGRELGRDEAWHWLGSVMKKAGLVATGKRVRSELPGKHGNYHVVWVDARWA